MLTRGFSWRPFDYGRGARENQSNIHTSGWWIWEICRNAWCGLNHLNWFLCRTEHANLRQIIDISPTALSLVDLPLHPSGSVHFESSLSHRSHRSLHRLGAQFVQCHASASVMTYQWVPDTEVPLGNYEVDNVCVYWGYYQSWVTDRALKGETSEEIGHDVWI
jgi:hypothetical protein